MADSRDLHGMIELALSKLTETEALDSILIHDTWEIGVSYPTGKRLRTGDDKLYEVRTAHTSQADWPPELAPALYKRITLEAGTQENPIAYAAGMELEHGKYYAENGVLYLCTRDTGAPVYNALADLVGIYVEVAE